MYACGHDSNGERNLEYEKLLPHQRMSMSSGQCPKCMELRNKRPSTDVFGHGEIKMGNVWDSNPAQMIPSDPEIFKIMRLFLEKYEVLAERDKEFYRKAISCFVNPPLIYDRNKGEAI
jgi:hypothetical protein